MNSLLSVKLLNSLVYYHDNCAVFFRNRFFSYSELLNSALAVSHELQLLGVGPGDRVAVISPKTPAALASMFGVLFAGCTYVPVDPKLPIPRQRHIIEDSGANVIVVPADFNSTLVDRTGADFVDIHLVVANMDGILESTTVALGLRSDRLIETLSETVSEYDLAYILYTSGSTGLPKGVSISHKNAMNFIGWALEYFGLEESDRVAIHSSFSFDLPVFDIYVGLFSGACLYPVSEEDVLFPQATLNFLNDHKITVLYAVPSSLIALLNRSAVAKNNIVHLKYLLFAGEEFPLKQFIELRNFIPHARFINMYGPIETNVITFFEVNKLTDFSRIPLGNAISNVRLLVIGNDGQEITSFNRVGELIVTGDSVSPGYWLRPDLTTASHMSRQDQGEQELYYRTGDLVSYDEQGRLIYHGRQDNMVKTRGFRVELEEVESVINSHPMVLQAAVIAKPHENYTNLLYAFVVANDGCEVDADSIKLWAAEYLPRYALPETVVFVLDLPKGNTGKVARKQLSMDE